MRTQARIARRKGCTVRQLNLEPLEQRLLLASDFGDAPSPYAVVAAEGGARHEAVGPMLGLLRDAEVDGVHSTAADADDHSGDSDEDGVSFGEVRVGQAGAIATVTVSGAPAGARLDGWIDFNGDGNWGGEGERILASQFVTDGVNELRFNVPSGARAGEAFTRFRISSAGGLGVGGDAADGEVEDHRATVLAPLASPGIFATRPLGEELFYSGRIQLGDMDGDGDLDFVSTVSGVTWHEVEGGATIATHLIAPKDRLSPPINDIEVCDLDGDGDLDVVVGGSTTLLEDPGAATFWLENLGAGAFSAHAMSPAFMDLAGISVVDIDSDGDLDVVGKDYDLTVLVNDGAQNFTARSFGPSSTTTAPIPFDFDGDSDLDMIVARGKELSLLENYGGLYFGTRALDAGLYEIRHVALADVDGDGDQDVVWSGGRDGLEWTETGASKPYTSHPIGWTSMLPGDSLFVADVNGDGREDIVTSSNVGTLWWERQEDGAFMPRELSRYWVQSPEVGDVDGDGDLDLVGIRGRAPYTITPTSFIWMENVSARVAVSATQATAEENGAAAITYRFRREGFVDRELTVGFDVQGSATFGSDYQQAGASAFSPSGGTIVFPAGVSEVQLMITPLDDAVIESNETIVIALPAGPDFLPEDAPAAVGRIVDNEAGDFGDAPGPYPTTLADDGARHGNTGPRLGARRDAESDGTPSPQANGDDATAGDDGVLFGELQVGQGDGVMYAYVVNAPAGARLDAWIDFNGDGHWGGLGEHVAASAVVVAGLNEIRFAVPADARSGTTFARVRLSTAGGLGAVGAAVDGEVEDHQIWINPPLGPGGPFAEPQPIAAGVYVEAFAHGDLDRDGDVDLVTIYDGSSWPPDQFFWYEKSANGFVAHEIPVPWDLGNLEYGGLLVADMNGDGWNDLVLRGDAAVVIMLNDRAGGFTQLPAVEGTTGTGYATNWVASLDADLDGDLDLMLQTKDGTQFEITLLVNRGDATFELQQATVGTIEFASAADIDGDGDVDLVGRLGYQYYSPVIGYNDGPGQMRITPLQTSLNSSYGDVQAVDLDGDGDLDLLASSDLLAWWENVGDEEFVYHHLGQLYGSDPGIGARAADFNGDGRMDVVAARARGTMIAWYQNMGEGGFVRRIVDGTAPNPTVVMPVDLDQDGDLDIVSRDYATSGLIWYENLSMLSGDYNGDGTVDPADYSVWRDALGATGLAPYSGADGDGDGVVDQDDYLVWKANFGGVDGSGDGAVESGFRPQAVFESGTAGQASSGTWVQAAGNAEHGAGTGARAMRWRRGLELLNSAEHGFRPHIRPPAEPGAGGRLLDSTRPRDLALLAWRSAALARWQGSRIDSAAATPAGIHSEDADEADGVFEALGSGALRLGTR